MRRLTQHCTPASLGLTALVLAVVATPSRGQLCDLVAPLHDGDFEIYVADPLDPASELLLVNTDPTTGEVALAQLEPATGLVVPGSRSPIGSDYLGEPAINGPEFFLRPTGELGVLWAAPDGVKGAFRIANPPPADWNLFDRDHAGNPGGPAILPSSPPGPDVYPGAAWPDGVGSYFVTCGPAHFGIPPHPGYCFGLYDAASPNDLTDVTSILEAGIVVGPHLTLDFEVSALAHHPTDAMGVGVSACVPQLALPCGLFLAQIDGSGGLASVTPAPVGPSLAGAAGAGKETLRGGVHPSSTVGDILWFIVDENNLIRVWEEDGNGTGFSLVLEVQALAKVEHVRVVDNGVDLVMYYQIRQNAAGTLPEFLVSTRVLMIERTGLVGGQETYAIKQLGQVSSIAYGTELVWLPAGQPPVQPPAPPVTGWWATYEVRTGGATDTIHRCWVN